MRRIIGRPAPQRRRAAPAATGQPVHRRHRHPCPARRSQAGMQPLPGKAPAGAGSHEPGQQVLVGGVHQQRVRGLAAVVQQRLPVGSGHALAEPVAKGRALGRRPLVHVARRPPAKTRCRLCVMLPLPRISTPSAASGASAAPSAKSCAGLQSARPAAAPGCRHRATCSAAASRCRGPGRLLGAVHGSPAWPEQRFAPAWPAPARPGRRSAACRACHRSRRSRRRFVPRSGQQHRRARQRVRDTARTAFGRPKRASMAGPSRCMKAPASRGSSAVIGEPWDRKSGGRGVHAALKHRPRWWVHAGCTQHSPHAGRRRPRLPSAP
jgi:hypothetical protein